MCGHKFEYLPSYTIKLPILNYLNNNFILFFKPLELDDKMRKGTPSKKSECHQRKGNHSWASPRYVRTLPLCVEPQEPVSLPWDNSDQWKSSNNMKVSYKDRYGGILFHLVRLAQFCLIVSNLLNQYLFIINLLRFSI